MKVYEITIRPLSGIGTPLKGDTLFGHICWQAAYDAALFGRSLDELLASYETTPFLVVSSAYPKICSAESIYYAFKRPDMPLHLLSGQDCPDRRELISKRKELKSKKWMLVRAGERIGTIQSEDMYRDDDGLLALIGDAEEIVFEAGVYPALVKESAQSHNTISRLTGTTGAGGFAPFVTEQSVYRPGIELLVFVVAEDSIGVDQVSTAFQRMGAFGFGRDASTGLGKFEVVAASDADLAALGTDNANAYYTLAPCLPLQDVIKKAYFMPFTRFGRHGDMLATSRNPFKNPVIMADEGAVLFPCDPVKLDKPYVGAGIRGVSKVRPGAVMQGYAPVIPVKVEACNG